MRQFSFATNVLHAWHWMSHAERLRICDFYSTRKRINSESKSSTFRRIEAECRMRLTYSHRDLIIRFDANDSHEGECHYTSLHSDLGNVFNSNRSRLRIVGVRGTYSKRTYDFVEIGIRTHIGSVVFPLRVTEARWNILCSSPNSWMHHLHLALHSLPFWLFRKESKRLRTIFIYE